MVEAKLCTTDDLELLRAWRAGDRRAGDELLCRYFDQMYRFFRNKVDADVEDLVQRTFVGCIEGRDRFQERSSFRTYIFAIAHNVLRDRFRRAQRVPIDLNERSVVDLGAGPLSLINARGEEVLLIQALRRIPVESQVLLELYYWEDLAVAQLAEIVEITLEAARSRLRRARQQLEASIQELRGSPELVASTLSDLETWARRLRGRIDST